MLRLSGLEPFAADSDEDMYRKILRRDYMFEEEIWQFISINAKVIDIACIRLSDPLRTWCRGC
jgi:hypothetical protein